MDVTFDAATQRIIATCDNTCGETHTFLKAGSSGAIVLDVTYTNPAVMPVDNLEGSRSPRAPPARNNPAKPSGPTTHLRLRRRDHLQRPRDLQRHLPLLTTPSR